MRVSRGGARLSYVVVKVEGEVEREVCEYVSPKHARSKNGERSRRGRRAQSGIVRKKIMQPGGYIVYFPRGHAVRFRDEDHLAQYGLDQEPDIINMQGLHHPKSPIGKLLLSQDSAARKGAMQDMREQVIRLATAKTGPIITPEQLEGRGHTVNEIATAEA